MIPELSLEVDYLEVAREALLEELESTDRLVPLNELGGTDVSLGPRALVRRPPDATMWIGKDTSHDRVLILIAGGGSGYRLPQGGPDEGSGKKKAGSDKSDNATLHPFPLIERLVGGLDGSPGVGRVLQARKPASRTERGWVRGWVARVRLVVQRGERQTGAQGQS